VVFVVGAFDSFAGLRELEEAIQACFDVQYAIYAGSERCVFVP
jgi:hypothetical protein